MEFARAHVKAIFSINRICKLCGISKNTYYDCKHPDERFSDKYKRVKIKIKKIIINNSAYGVKRIKKALLDDCGIEISRNALGRLLRLWSLGLKRKLRAVQKSVVKKILETLADRNV